MQKLKFRLELIPGPTLCTAVATGKKYDEHHVHRTAFSLYLNLANIGSAPASIDSIEAAFHWSLIPISWLWIRYRLFWYWLPHPVVSMEAFQYDLGGSIKVYPSLLQANSVTGGVADTYLEVGQSTNGVVYFEHDHSWGGCFPAPTANGNTKIRVAVVDSFQKKYKKTFLVSIVSWTEARKYNPSFGGAFARIKSDENWTDLYETLNNQVSRDASR